jgi:hypothetical protein
LLEETLLGYLEANRGICWPGGDGLTVRDVLDCYRLASRHGRVPGPSELSRLHPQLRDELTAFFCRSDV